MDFELAYREFLAFHASRRRGERLRRLREGHGHAEREFLKFVWWPAFGNLRYLHPEYEVVDFDGRRRYLDFAYIRGGLRLAVEIDGYGPHLAYIGRRQYIDQLRRQNHLVLDGWALLRFSFDEVQEQPRSCQQMLQQFVGRWSEHDELSALTFLQRSVVRLALESQRSITPKQIRTYLGVGRRVAANVVRSLVEQGWLEPDGGRQRIRSYRLNRRRLLV